jgi:hypothetical protein
MSGNRSRYGLLISALGAILLAVSVFLPWYGLSFTTTGIGFVQQVAGQVASQYGNATLQSYVGAQHASLNALAGQQFAALSAHQVLKNLNIVLLVLAALAMLDALIPLARAGGSGPDGGGAAVVLLGTIATLCVLYRVLQPPTPAGNLLALSLREGAWLALLGSVAIVAGGLAPSRLASAERGAPEVKLESAWSGLSGWTPGA